MNNLKRISALAAAVMILLGLSFQPSLAQETFTLSKDGKDWLVLTAQKDRWEAKSPTLTLNVIRKDNKYEFRTPSAVYILKEKEDGKYKLRMPDGTLLFKVKKNKNKLKISQTEDDKEARSVKLKDDGSRYSVKKGDAEAGQVKFYPDRSEIKVKTASGAEVSAMNSLKLRSAPAVSLFNELSEEQRLILFTMLMIID